jgi:hypothetical protein
MRVEVKLDAASTAQLNALQIKLRTDPERWEEEVEGYLDRVDEDTATIDGRNVVLMPNTALIGGGAWKGKSFSTFKDVPLGSLVDLKGIRQKNGTILVSQGSAKPNIFTALEGQLIKSVQDGLTVPPSDKMGAGIKIGGVVYKVVEDLSVNTFVNMVGNRVVPKFLRNLPPEDPNKVLFRFYVLEDETPNATAFSDGSVFINTGLLRRLDNEAQLAIILGHEIAHITNEHVRRRYETSQNQALLAGMMGAAASSVLGQQGGLLIARLGYGLLSNKFSRELEDQADRVGLYYAYQAGYDVREATKIWRKLMGVYNEGAVGTSLYADHPSMLARLKDMRRETVLNYANADFSEVVTGREKFLAGVGVYFGWIQPKPVIVPPAPPAANAKAKGKPAGSKNTPASVKPGTKKVEATTSNNASAQKTPGTGKPAGRRKIPAKTAPKPKPAPTIRSINFRNFSFPVSRACSDDVKGNFARVVRGNVVLRRDKTYGPQGFEVAKVIYGDLTGDGKEEAVVSTVCGNLEPTSFNQSPYGNTYVYTMAAGKPVLMSHFDDSAFAGAYEGYFGTETFIAMGGAEKIVNNRLYYGVLGLEGMCCPKWNVQMILRWDGSRFVVTERPQRTPWQ